jgi:catechol 2,3-dioxygenase-like lactoylglutathione lyase family enzyme
VISSARGDEAALLWPDACRRVCCDHIEGRVEEQDRHHDEPTSARPAERTRSVMAEAAPHIDFANLPTPAEGFLVTLFITVRKVAKSRDFYSRVLGGTVVLDENPCIVKLSNSWIIMNPGGPPTPDKPDISVVDYQPGSTTSIFMNLRVADIRACYQEWKAKGAEFVTPPIDRGAEIRCYMRDPDGYLIEVGQSTGLLHGELAAKRPEDLPG